MKAEQNADEDAMMKQQCTVHADKKTEMNMKGNDSFRVLEHLRLCACTTDKKTR